MAHPGLPHHRAYGAVYGGSQGERKASMLFEEAHETQMIRVSRLTTSSRSSEASIPSCSVGPAHARARQARTLGDSVAYLPRWPRHLSP